MLFFHTSQSEEDGCTVWHLPEQNGNLSTRTNSEMLPQQTFITFITFAGDEHSSNTMQSNPQQMMCGNAPTLDSLTLL